MNPPFQPEVHPPAAGHLCLQHRMLRIWLGSNDGHCVAARLRDGSADSFDRITGFVVFCVGGNCRSNICGKRKCNGSGLLFREAPKGPLDTESSPTFCRRAFILQLQGVNQDAQFGQPTLRRTMRIRSALGGCVPRKRSPGSAASWKKSTPRSASYPARSAIFAPRASASSSYSLE